MKIQLRYEDPQKVNITASYDGGAPIEILRWEASGPNFHDDAPNESVVVALNNPAGASTLKLTFGYFDTLNNWWWAVDNIEVTTGSVTTDNLGEITISVSGGNATLNWTGGPGIRVRTTSTLSPVNWQDVPGTEGQSSAVLPLGPDETYYQLFQP